MKDIVENRKRIGFGQKLRLAALALKENGPLWCALLFGYYVASSTANKAFTAMASMRRRRNLPGLNSATLNKAIWDSWDWSAQGDEWTWSEEWKSSLIHNVLWREIEIDRD